MFALRSPGSGLRFLEHPFGPPITAFADKELTIPHAHPVIADANGVFPPIFLAGKDPCYTTDVVAEDQYGKLLFSMSPIGMNALVEIGLKTT